MSINLPPILYEYEPSPHIWAYSGNRGELAPIPFTQVPPLSNKGAQCEMLKLVSEKRLCYLTLEEVNSIQNKRLYYPVLLETDKLTEINIPEFEWKDYLEQNNNDITPLLQKHIVLIQKSSNVLQTYCARNFADFYKNIDQFLDYILRHRNGRVDFEKTIKRLNRFQSNPDLLQPIVDAFFNFSSFRGHSKCDQNIYSIKNATENSGLHQTHAVELLKIVENSPSNKAIVNFQNRFREKAVRIAKGERIFEEMRDDYFQALFRNGRVSNIREKHLHSRLLGPSLVICERLCSGKGDQILSSLCQQKYTEWSIAEVPRRICEALNGMHQTGYIYGALDPENIYIYGTFTGKYFNLDAPFELKLANFKHTTLFNRPITSFLPNSNFQSPEAIEAHLSRSVLIAHPSQDVFSAGAFIYAMLFAMLNSAPCTIGKESFYSGDKRINDITEYLAIAFRNKPCYTPLEKKAYLKLLNIARRMVCRLPEERITAETASIQLNLISDALQDRLNPHRKSGSGLTFCHFDKTLPKRTKF